jgi:hexose-6-phosphate dehydrogenase
MDLSGLENGDPARALKSKEDFLGSFEDARLEHAVVGQYEGYTEHCRADRNDQAYTTKTPTFAAASLRVKNGRWDDVPVLIIAGKMLEERAAYVEVQFKDLSYPKAATHPETPHHATDPRSRIVFHIQGGALKRGPEVRLGFLVANHFLATHDHGAPHGEQLKWVPGDGWETVSGGDLPHSISKLSAAVFVNGTAGKPDLPYDVLMSAMFNGAQDLFVGTGGLMQSWRLWDTLLTQSAEADSAAPFVYKPGSTYREIIAQAASENHRIHEDL